MTAHKPTDLHDFFNGMTPPALVQPKHPLWSAVREALCTVQDPEHDVNIYELGLVQSVSLTDNDSGKTDVALTMTLTTAWCPVAADMPGWVHTAVSKLDKIGKVDVKVSFAKPWAHDHMTESAKIALNLI